MSRPRVVIHNHYSRPARDAKNQPGWTTGVNKYEVTYQVSSNGKPSSKTRVVQARSESAVKEDWQDGRIISVKNLGVVPSHELRDARDVTGSADVSPHSATPTREQEKEIRSRGAKGESIQKIHAEMGFSLPTIKYILTGRQ